MRRSGWHRVLVSVLSVFGLVAVTACNPDKGGAQAPTTQSPVEPVPVTTAPPGGGVLRLGLVGPDTVDPGKILPTDPVEVVQVDLLFDGLTAIDPASNDAVPAIASEWSANDTHTVWRFTLRPGASFSDGSPVTAADVKFSLERLARNGSVSIAGSRLDIVDGYSEFVAATADELRGIKVADSGTVEITTREPFVQLPLLLASPAYGIVSKASFDAPDLTRGVLASGPFKVVSRSTDGRVARLERTPTSRARLDAVELVHFTDPASAYSALVEGSIDWTLVPPDKVDDARTRFGDANFTPLGAELFFGINVADPKFTNPQFRLAILKAIDRSGLVSSLFPGRTAINGVVPPGIPGALADPCGLACTYDPVGAKQLLYQAFIDAKAPDIDLHVTDDPIDASMAALVSQELGATGIRTRIVAKPFEEHRRLTVGQDKQVFRYGWVGLYPDPDAFLGPLFLSGSQDNVTGFSSGEVDGLIRDARATPDRDARLAKYQVAEARLMAQSPIVPLVNFTTYVAVAPNVHDFHQRFDGTFVTDDITVGNK